MCLVTLTLFNICVFGNLRKMLLKLSIINISTATREKIYSAFGRSDTGLSFCLGQPLSPRYPFCRTRKERISRSKENQIWLMYEISRLAISIQEKNHTMRVVQLQKYGHCIANMYLYTSCYCLR